MQPQPVDSRGVPACQEVVTFGPFELDRRTLTLRKDGKPVAARSRAMEILLALTEREGAILSNRELLRRVWPKTVVEEGTVRVHVALLRKILRDADPGGDYIQNVTGRGYRFVAPVGRRLQDERNAPVPSHLEPGARNDATVLRPPVWASTRRSTLPTRLTSVFGDSRIVGALATRVSRERLVTLTGPGGIGKTTMAIRIAEVAAAAFVHGVRFVDLASVSRDDGVARALASALGVPFVAEEPMRSLLAHLSGQSMLIVLDNCEHVIDDAARVVENVLLAAARVHVLATSREPLRASGELTHEVAPLEAPVVHELRSHVQWLDPAAVQLFLSRADLYEEVRRVPDDLALVAEICRRLGGNPLAIEIAAAHVRWLGLKALAAGLHDELLLSLDGQRTAHPKHRSLRASFEWSYGLLSPTQQAVFRRLSVFTGRFDAERAVATLQDDSLTRAVIVECLIDLARKSLIVSTESEGGCTYRLSDLARAFARMKLREARELTRTERRHSRIGISVAMEQIQAYAGLWRMAWRFSA